MESNEQTANGGVFINGKAQIIEMLQFMKGEEKDRLLKNIKARNPSLAEELMEQSFTFAHISNLKDYDLRTLMEHVEAPILGVALKNQEPEFQRRVLSTIPRENAEEAFNIMNKRINNEPEMIKKAQNKVINVLINLSKKQHIDLSQ